MEVVEDEEEALEDDDDVELDEDRHGLILDAARERMLKFSFVIGRSSDESMEEHVVE